MTTIQTVKETLGPAEKILQTLLTFTDHAVHNRQGYLTKDNRFNIGVKWHPATHKNENNQTVIYKLDKVGKKSVNVRIGILQDDKKTIKDGHSVIGEYRNAGLFPEVITYLYRQVAEVYKLDNEFAAKWASYAFKQEHRDLKTVLAAFMLVQNRKGDPVVEGGKVLFNDSDYRDVGEAMVLSYGNSGNSGNSGDNKTIKNEQLNPKLLWRIYEILNLPQIAQINRELGFGKSNRTVFLGRWPKAIEKWLRFREQNVKLLEGLVKAGFRSTIINLARAIGYKPTTPKFFELLRWKQSQSKLGHRNMAIDVAVVKGDLWTELTEAEICQQIVNEGYNWKFIVSKLPPTIRVTRAIMTAAIEAGSLSEKDLIMYTPTLEELGLLTIPLVKQKWEKALKNANDSRAANIAKNVKSQVVKDKLNEAADVAVQKAVEEVTKNIRIYMFVDISGSMENSIEAAKKNIAKFAQGFPLDKLHVATFNTDGKEIKITHASSAGVENAFRGISAGGGTDHSSGIKALKHRKPLQDEDVIFIWVGDEGQSGSSDAAIKASGLNPTAFGLLRVVGQNQKHVTSTAARLGIPCFLIDENTFDDVYAIPRTMRALIASAPIGQTLDKPVVRMTLVETILATSLLSKPNWAA